MNNQAKVETMNEHRLNVKAVLNLVCHDCEEKFRSELKQLGYRAHKDKDWRKPIVVPYYFLHKVCPHYQDFIFKSEYAEIPKDGKRTDSAGVEITSGS